MPRLGKAVSHRFSGPSQRAHSQAIGNGPIWSTGCSQLLQAGVSSLPCGGPTRSAADSAIAVKGGTRWMVPSLSRPIAPIAVLTKPALSVAERFGRAVRARELKSSATPATKPSSSRGVCTTGKNQAGRTLTRNRSVPSGSAEGCPGSLGMSVRAASVWQRNVDEAGACASGPGTGRASSRRSRGVRV